GYLWFNWPKPLTLKPAPIPSTAPRIDARASRGNDPRSSVIDPLPPVTKSVPPPAVSAPAKKPESNPPVVSVLPASPSRIDGRGSMPGKPGNDPRSTDI